jgi:ribosome assembly protein 1
MIRVAVEAQHGRDISKLEAGLRRLYQADPAVEISVQQSGEQVVAALGELHLEQCLKDLELKYARVPLRVSPPLVRHRCRGALCCQLFPFREIGPLS